MIVDVLLLILSMAAIAATMAVVAIGLGFVACFIFDKVVEWFSK